MRTLIKRIKEFDWKKYWNLGGMVASSGLIITLVVYEEIKQAGFSDLVPIYCDLNGDIVKDKIIQNRPYSSDGTRSLYPDTLYGVQISDGQIIYLPKEQINGENK